MRNITVEDQARVMLWGAVGQTFLFFGMVIAKWSLGLFLLRLVIVPWHKMVIWVSMIIVMGASIATVCVFWLQCSPPAYLWDRRIPGGQCDLDVIPAATVLNVACVVVDFLFAVFPWVFVWKLRMNRREKIIVLTSMSLGVIAGACGIERSLKVSELYKHEYLMDNVNFVIWSAAEMAVTMVCITIPICRPLYKSIFDRWISPKSSGYQKQSDNSHELRTFGGNTMPPRADQYSSNKALVGHGDDLGVPEHSVKTYITSAGRVQNGNPW
ncbi:hypothetical protein F5B20DRAFT_558375 [Whalleya microplaca]|nr:hypothetical protein F5B20DRAFT_558375 [Whalleya microplaca]